MSPPPSMCTRARTHTCAFITETWRCYHHHSLLTIKFHFFPQPESACQASTKLLSKWLKDMPTSLLTEKGPPGRRVMSAGPHNSRLKASEARRRGAPGDHSAPQVSS